MLYRPIVPALNARTKGSASPNSSNLSENMFSLALFTLSAHLLTSAPTK